MVKYLQDPLNRAIYATDASNYRIVPDRIAQPENLDQLRDTILEALSAGVPLTMRGRGTSCSGNSIGPGLVIDTSHHCNRILSLDPSARQITVEPGVVLADIQKAGAPFGLRFGPDPSTWTRATVGGSIGNNACGPHAQAWGRVADNVISMDVIDGFGREFRATSGEGALDVVPGLQRLVDENLALIRTECGRFHRQVSGYSLEHLLPENGRDLAKFLVGSEGTLVSVLRATLRLVPVPTAPVLVVLGYPDMIAAAADVPLINDFSPLAVEGMDSRLVYTLAHKPGVGELPELPEGNAWLLVEMGSATADLETTLARANDLAQAANTRATLVLPPSTQATKLWRIRADGAGLGGRTPLNPDGSGNDPAWPGWEDAAVPPQNLAAYLRDFTDLMREMNVDGMLYGHLGDGCLHVRLNLPLGAEAGQGRSREFLERAADLVGKYHGSLSGEHGDGRARSELLPRMYSPALIRLFKQVKALFDPRGLMNPGVLVDPDPLDANLRLAGARTIPALPGSGFTFPKDTDFTAAVHRCTGVGKCLAMNQVNGAWMCPSYLATGQEQDATRGRARVLQEVTNGTLIRDFRDPNLLRALDLCLACKACSAACPTGIDMAAYKSESLYRAYRRRLRPRSHYLLGRLPGWLRLARRIPGGAGLANSVFGVAWIRHLVFRMFGLDPRRQMAHFNPESFRTWARRRGGNAAEPEIGANGLVTPTTEQTPDTTGQVNAVASSARANSQPAPEAKPWVAVWADSFSEGIAPDGAKAVVELLETAGYQVYVPPQACCGLTYVTTGQLDKARRNMRRLCQILGPLAVNGIPIVGVEPSCTATLRDDLERLLPDDPRAQAIAQATCTLAELLSNPDTAPNPDVWQLPDLRGVQVVAQPHCHHYSVLGWETDRKLLAATGAEVVELAGCCGMAGNFGMERGHIEVSKRIAEHALLPALREHPNAIFLADGFSCRTQAEQLAGSHGIHLARLLLGPSSRVEA